MVGRHQLCVDGQLHSAEEGLTFIHHLQSSLVGGYVQAPDPDIGGNPRATLSADLPHRTFNCTPTPAEHPRQTARRSVMAKAVKEMITQRHG